MIELTWAHVRDHNFQQGLEKLASTPFEFKTGYQVSKIKAKVVSEATTAQEWFVKLVKTLGELNEETGQFKIKPENEEKWKEEVKSFSETKFTIEKNKLNVADLSIAKLTPNEIMALEPILFGLEVLEGGGENGKS